MIDIGRIVRTHAAWIRCLIPLLLLASTAWSEVTGPVNTSVAAGDTVVLRCHASFNSVGQSCVWYRNGVAVTAGVTFDASKADWLLTFIATSADNNAKYQCVVSGNDKGGFPSPDQTSPIATVTVVASTAPVRLILPVVGTRVTADTTLNPPGIQFFASRPVKTWEVNFPATDATFRAFGSAASGDTSNILPLPTLATSDRALRIRITSLTNEVFTGDYVLGAQQIAPITLAPAVFSAPFYFAFYGTPFSVDQQHGLARFTRDRNGDAVTYTKASGADLSLNADGSFSWNPPAMPAGLTFPGSSLQSQQVLAGTYRATDGINPSVGPFEIRVTVYANPGDLNRDGVVNIQDVQLVLARYGQSPGVPTDP